jgi:hypothetical protein
MTGVVIESKKLTGWDDVLIATPHMFAFFLTFLYIFDCLGAVVQRLVVPMTLGRTLLATPEFL